MIKKASIVILIWILICTTLTSCYDAREVDDEVYALVIGVDKGVSNKVRITMQYPTYKSGGDSGGGQGDKSSGGMGSSNAAPGSDIQTIEASTILEALDMYGMAISRRISLMHTKMLVFSEDFARGGVGKYLAPIARYRETRRVMNVVVVKGKAEGFLRENQANIGESISKAMELMVQQSDNTSFFPRVTFNDFYRGMLSSFEQPYTIYAGINGFEETAPEKKENNAPLVISQGFLPGGLPRSGSTKREYAGTAVFDGDKMVGFLDSDETRYFLMVTGKFKRGIIDLEDERSPGDAIPLDLRPGRAPVTKGHFENGLPVVDLKLQMEADIGAIQSRINYEKLGLIEELNNQVEKHIKDNIVKVINKVQKEYKSDIFGFGHKFAGYFPTIPEWEKYDWIKHFEEARINVNVDVNIRRTGLMIDSSKIYKKDNTEEDIR